MNSEVKTIPERTNNGESRTAWSINEFCAQVGITRATLYRRIADGSIRVTKFGRRSLITAAERQRIGL